jgi:hypothetical protein
MTTIYSHSTLDAQPSFDWKAALAEPFLIVATSAFWLVTLPPVALAVFSVKIWDTMTGLLQRQANPLILRRGNTTSGHPSLAQRRSTKQA